MRNLKFVKYLRDFNWEPIVYIPKNAAYPYIDTSNNSDIPANLTIIEQSILEPHNLFKSFIGQKKDSPLNNPVAIKNKSQGWREQLGIWIRGNFFIPDARMFWIKPSVKKLIKYLHKNPVDVIYTDGPPHTNTRIGALVSEKTGIPWLADFQDPWTQVDYLQRFKLSSFAWHLHKKMEQHAFKNASKITSASPRSAKELEKIGAHDVSCLYYGFDEEDFVNISTVETDKFIVTHSGLLGNDRNPIGLFNVLAQLLQEEDSFKNHLLIKLVGDVDVEVIEEIQNKNLSNYVEITGIVPRGQALKQISNSSLLLLCINKASNADGRIPAKIFEYIRTGNDILALGPPISDISDILKTVEQGTALNYDDELAIKNRVLESYHSFILKRPRTTHKNVRNYDVKEITGKLAAFFNQLVNE